MLGSEGSVTGVLRKVLWWASGPAGKGFVSLAEELGEREPRPSRRSSAARGVGEEGNEQTSAASERDSVSCEAVAASLFLASAF